jgi:hypothetical protein
MIKDFKAIRATCEENSRISARVIDEFLIGFAAGYQNLGYKTEQKFAAFRHITRKFDKDWVGLLQAQYIVHRVLRSDGLIQKFLKHPAFRQLNEEETDFLQQQAKQPWRFSFSVIIEKPAEDFYLMEDIFSGEQYILFSPGITQLVQKERPILWFNLVGFNGLCWQSFGPIGAYRGFEPDDIFYFATELRPDIEDEEEILEDVQNDPIPYMMLLSGANHPLTFNKKDQMVQVVSEFKLDHINTKDLRKSFKTEYSNGVYRFTLKEWGEFPHYANAFFDENRRIILFSAMTDRGYRALAAGLNAYGHHFPDEPFICVNTSMLVTAQEILKKELVLNEYDHLFHRESTETNKEEIDKLNAFMQLILPDINAGRKPDIESMAKKAGVDIETARDIVRNVLGKFDEMDQSMK